MTYRPSNPDGIMFVPNVSDYRRAWALTLKEPIAGLMVAGKIWAFTKSTPPPRRLIGQRIHFQAGQALVKIGPVKENVPLQKMISIASGAEPDAWRQGLDVLSKKNAGKVLGSAVLRAAFVTGGLRPITDHGVCAVSFRPDSNAPRYLGEWRSFDGRTIIPVGNWSAPSRTARTWRWAWCFSDPQLNPKSDERLKGFGGLWDLEKGLAFRREQERQSK